MVNSGSETINAAQAKLTYDAAKLEYVGGANPTVIFQMVRIPVASGAVTVAGYGPGTFTGDQLLQKLLSRFLLVRNHHNWYFHY